MTKRLPKYFRYPKVTYVIKADHHKDENPTLSVPIGYVWTVPSRKKILTIVSKTGWLVMRGQTFKWLEKHYPKLYVALKGSPTGLLPYPDRLPTQTFLRKKSAASFVKVKI